jgi:hypothetical protein
MARQSPRSFLLRLWRERADATLRATLIPVGRPQSPHHFATLDELQAFLRAEADGVSESTGIDLIVPHPLPTEQEMLSHRD